MNRLQLKTGLSVKLSQRLKLTPALQQKIKLLSLNQVGLAELLKQELSENPVLEELTDLGMTTEDQQNTLDGEEASNEKVLSDTEIDYFFEDYLPSPSRTRLEREKKNDYLTTEDTLAKPLTLQDHLNWQLNLTEVRSNIYRIAYFIIGNINSDGYLCGSDTEICQQLDVSLEDLNEALLIVQSFDPIGVCARTLKECLLIQLCGLGHKGSVADKLVRKHLGNIGNNQNKSLAKSLKCKVSEIDKALKLIRRLSPAPGQQYNLRKPQFVEPDVYVKKGREGYKVIISDDGLPKLRINTSYRRILRNKSISKETKSFVRERFRSAIDLLKGVNQREDTLYRVCEWVVKHQKRFLDNGFSYLKPLLIKDVAKKLEVHSSTVSRIVSNKFIHTPQGVLELRIFFNIGIEGVGNQSFSQAQVKEIFRKIIKNEDPFKPLSDRLIVELLTNKGIKITRRTIAKYRSQMNIEGSRKRNRTT